MAEVSEVADMGAKLEAEQTVIAGLCAFAPNVEIRDCLCLYNPRNNTHQHKNEFHKWNKPTLLDVLNFLEMSSQ